VPGGTYPFLSGVIVCMQVALGSLISIVLVALLPFKLMVILLVDVASVAAVEDSAAVARGAKPTAGAGVMTEVADTVFTTLEERRATADRRRSCLLHIFEQAMRKIWEQ
jgi:hypothetical protein